MDTPVLQTKFHIPMLRKDHVLRGSLLDRMDAGVSNRLTLVCGPAGSGKSTLVSQWIHNRRDSGAGHDFAWLSLDSSDGDGDRFLTYFIAALQTVDEEWGQVALSLVTAPFPTDVEAVVTLLINEIADRNRNTVVVLDDYHLVESPEVDRGLNFLLDYMPPNLHLVVVSRIDPSLSLSRFRARGQMIELREKDLRFNSEETAGYFHRNIGRDLSESEASSLTERTEGWVAGLQLAAISMRRSENPAEFIRTFTEATGHILDYLSDEVLSGQPREIQDFLMQTSILDRFTPPLGDAVTGRDDAGETIEHLVRENLFVISLDPNRRWYRYHHLFRELLSERLHRLYRETVPVLHGRASRWFGEHELIPEAFDHARLSDDPSQATEILVRRWHVFTHRGEFPALRRMLDSLGCEVTDESGPLSMAWCWYHHYTGSIEKLKHHLAYARRATEARDPGREGEMAIHYAAIPSQVEAMEAVVRLAQGNPAAAKDSALKGLDLIPEEAPPPVQGLLWASAGFWLAQAHRDLGETDEACAVYLKLIDLMKVAENQVGGANALWQIGKLYEISGRRAETIVLCRETLDYIASRGWDELPPTGVVHLVLAMALKETGGGEEGREHLEEGRRLLKPMLSDHYRSLLREAESRFPAADGRVDGLAEALSERELEVLGLIDRGLSNHEIAERLFLALSTVKGHNQNIFEKLQVKRRTEAVARARERGLL